MTNIRRFLALSLVTTTLSSGALLGQDHHDDHPGAPAPHQNHPYVRHDDWKKGVHMNHDDWNRGERIDYRTYHLRTPPRGYEWREIDGNYVLGAIATGIIASTIIASAAH